MEERPSIRQATLRPEGTMTVLAESQAPPIRTEVLHFSSTAGTQFWDLTEVVREVLARAGVQHGQVTVYSPHTTTSVVINESESGFVNDFRRLITMVVPQDDYYEHDDLEIRTENLQEDEYRNGHAHCRQLLVGATSATIPVVEGELLIGPYQRVLFLELDQARERRVVIHAQGI